MKRHAIKLRIALAPNSLLGSGKADLLQAIKETGSLGAACRRMGMSSKRASYLLDTMNAAFCEPLAKAATGRNSDRSARLTKTGVAVLAAFRRMETAAKRAVIKEMTTLSPLMKEPTAFEYRK